MTNPIARLNAALEGRYRIEREIGEGGMATVYLADDLRHDRKVALKLLKPELAAVVGAERFLAEIKTTANLQHPHILPLFDSGEADGFLFFVMPYVEGDTLRDKIDREKQLSLAEAVRIAEKVAAALDYAHKHGVVHRDIKPGNILLSAEGEPTIADFGIALAVAQAGRGRVTETGLSMGTPSYMSPEQATGDRDVDPRTDVYALGCVLYEMLIGEPPYTGSTAQAILGKIIQGTPVSATAARTTVPPNVDAVIRKALEKLPADRFGSALELAKALGDPAFRHGGLGAVAAGPGTWRRVAIGAIGLAVLSVATLGWFATRPAPTAPIARFAMPFETGQAPLGALSNARLTADGSALVYIGPNASGAGSPQLWIRRWSDLGATPVRGTEAPQGFTFFALSPDGREVAFPLPDRLTVVPLDAGPARTLVDAANGVVWEWGSDGWIYFTEQGSGLVRVPASGGGQEEIEILTTLDGAGGEIIHGLFTLLPGGRAGVFQVWHAINAHDAEIWALDLETRTSRYLTSGANPRYAATGHLLFTTPEGDLMAVDIDTGTADLIGTARPVLDGLQLDPIAGTAQYWVSDDGTLIYQAGAGMAGFLGSAYQPMWVNRAGEASPVDPTWRVNVTFTGGQTAGLHLSPRGDRIAISATVNGNTDIYIKEVRDGLFQPLTRDDVPETTPTWSPDGAYVYYAKADDTGNYDLWRSRADFTGAPDLILDDERSLMDPQVSPDGAWIVLRAGPGGAENNRSPERDIVAFRPGVDTEAATLIGTPEFVEYGPSLSPDGRWLAYVSNLSGRDEVYVSPFPEVASGRWRVSTEGGMGPVWSRDGSELFFLDATNGWVAARVEGAAEFRVLQRTTLFATGSTYLYTAARTMDVAVEDDRFLMISIGGELGGLVNEAPRFILVQNWFEELLERMGER